MLQDLEGNTIDDDCQVTFTLEFEEFYNLRINANNEIVLTSPDSWFENLDTPLPATLVIENESTGQELFRLGFYVIITETSGPYQS